MSVWNNKSKLFHGVTDSKPTEFFFSPEVPFIRIQKETVVS